MEYSIMLSFSGDDNLIEVLREHIRTGCTECEDVINLEFLIPQVSNVIEPHDQHEMGTHYIRFNCHNHTAEKYVEEISRLYPTITIDVVAVSEYIGDDAIKYSITNNITTKADEGTTTKEQDYFAYDCWYEINDDSLGGYIYYLEDETAESLLRAYIDGNTLVTYCAEKIDILKNYNHIIANYHNIYYLVYEHLKKKKKLEAFLSYEEE